MTQNSRLLLLILLLGALLRFVFYQWLAEIYYSTPDFFEQGDTSTWFRSIHYLITTGTYTYEPGIVNGEFFRPPGYAFLMLPFYLLSGGQTQLTYHWLGIFQIVLDVLAIWFVYKIAIRLFKNNNYALLCALVYACFPFIIVWTPVAMAEAASVFFMLGGIYFFLHKDIRFNFFLSGLFIGMMVLTRIQSVFIIFGFAVACLLSFRLKQLTLKQAIIFFTGFICLYGLWPLRNYVLHHRIVFTQDYRIGRNWSDDYLSFMNYIYSVQSDFQPAYSQIIKGEPVQWPAASYKFEGDSLLLDSAVRLSRTCGKGFSKFMFHEKMRTTWIDNGGPNCDSLIAGIFNSLAEKQYRQNAFNAWLAVPLTNLKKAFFKSSLYGNKSALVKTSTNVLFAYRSFILIAGLAGVVLLLKRSHNAQWLFTLSFVYLTTWFLYISFIYRNVEIRYLLQCDVLMIFPATAFVYSIFLRLKNKTLTETD